MKLFLLTATALAAAIDFMTMKIPNWLTGSLLLIGNIWCLWQEKVVYLLISIMVLLLFLPFNIGGGDKKLLMAMPLYLQEETMAFLGLFSLSYLSYYYYYRVFKQQRACKPLGPLILLALILTIVWIKLEALL